MRSAMALIQQLGRALMLPIAVLPVAGLLLRLGQPDLIDIAFVTAAGAAIFDNLGLLFAIGVAVGFARENHGAAGLAGVVAFLVASHGAKTLIHVPPEAIANLSGTAIALGEAAFRSTALFRLSVPIGILSGVIAGLLYNRFSDIKLPEYLAFFGGRRFVPIVGGFSGLLVAAVFGFGWDYVDGAMDLFSHAIIELGDFGLFLYGVLNRVLIVTGLHHILNNVAWFVVGDFEGATGDLRRFFAGDPSAGSFMSGFFPVMMFGLPAACLAMYRTARSNRRKAVGGMLLSMALTSHLTGVTEPIEFTFMFLAPVLYGVHAILTGLSMVFMQMLEVRLGFTFSAGLFDYALNFQAATRPLLLLPIGAAYFVLYYVVFRWCIVHFDLKTPGRETASSTQVVAPLRGDEAQALAFIQALGGAENLSSVETCTTRLRLEVVTQAAVNEDALRALGAKGFVRPSESMLQVVLGPIADQVANDIRKRLKVPLVAVRPDTPKSDTAHAAAPSAAMVEGVMRALGGAHNVVEIVANWKRLFIRVVDDGVVDIDNLQFDGIRGVARPIVGSVHLLVDMDAEYMAAELRQLRA